MRFSLVVATLGREEELGRLLASLRAQSFTDFEVILVDQNPMGRLEDLVSEASRGLTLRHLRCDPGLSRARNTGLEKARGEIIAFPDDDCRYPEDLLENVDAYFQAHPDVSGLSGAPVTTAGETTGGRFARSTGSVDRFNVWTRAVSCCLFFRRDAVESAGGFDPDLGLGSSTGFGSAEETDYTLRVLAAGHRVRYEPEIARVVHENPVPDHDGAALERGRSYGAGMGRVLRLHGYPAWFASYLFLRALGGAMLAAGSLRFREARYHLSVLVGRLWGWSASP